jgi:predicted amidohydrolase
MEKKDKLTIAAVQFNSAEKDKELNLNNMEGFIKKAADQKADIISFPEICITGYNFILYTEDRNELFSIAEPVPDGPSVKRIMEMAGKYNIVVLFGLLEKEGEEKLFNCYVTARPDGTFEKYHKIHAFENSLMQQGSEYPVFDLFGWKCGVLICYDNNQPENPRIYSLRGCELLFAPHQTGAFDMECAGMGRIDIQLWDDIEKNRDALFKEFQGPKGREWIVKWLPSRAYDNNMYHVFANGVGLDHDELRTGNAMILDPNGIILAESKSVEPDLVIAQASKSALQGTLGQSHMRTRTTEIYGDLVKEQKDRVDTRSARNKMTVNSDIV